jgi:hypothetical protein
MSLLIRVLRRPAQVTPACLAALVALAGCQAPPPPPPAVVATTPPADTAVEATAVGEAPAGLSRAPSCPRGVTAMLKNDVTVVFEGSAREKDVCLEEWDGQRHEFFLGFWGDGLAYRGSEQERDAVRSALTGPVGSHASFRPQAGRLWGEATVDHVANPVLLIAGRPRPTVELRQVMHDAHGRENVRAEFLIWVDQATGIPLQRKTVTRMADGSDSAATTWLVQSLSPAAAL